MEVIPGLRLTHHFVLLLALPMQTVTFYSHQTYRMWVRGLGQSFLPFIANRIGKFEMVRKLSQWQRKVTGESPGDLCTRRVTPASHRRTYSGGWTKVVASQKSEERASRHKMDVSSRPASIPEIKTSSCNDAFRQRLIESGREEWLLEPIHFSS